MSGRGAGVGDEESSDESSCCHDHWRIGLYYAYIELSPSEIQLHLEVQKQICEDLQLKGRIRISTEGVNGVVSGSFNSLQRYEKRISIDIQRILLDEIQGEGEGDKKKKRLFFSSATNDDDDDNDENENENGGDDGDDETIVALDVKYCQLRKELPIQEQLFDRLIVKETKTVISLFDQSFEQKQDNDQNGGCGRSSKTNRYRRRRERKRKEQTRRMHDNQNNQSDQFTQQQQQCIVQDNDDNSNKNKSNIDDENNNKEIMKLAEGNIPSTPTTVLNLQSLHKVVMEKPLQPARHLSATEWNTKLDEIESSDSALLLDVRNVYEMRVGRFVHPITPTLLTNTRKYSDLPQLLASNEDIKKREQIFMYCTGGVRCERVSMLVHELYPDKEIYQLRGGIQTYLQTCSEEQKHQEKQQQQDGTDKTPENGNNTNSYFEGKNFVFDPRRTDPIHFGKIVGRCLVCDQPHDDYDNGHAPSKNKEARCNQCRMLVLICNDCRPNYRCHGEKEKVEEENKDSNDKDLNCDESRNTNCRPLLYCTLDHCSHEGTLPDPELRMSIQNNK